MEAWSRIEQPNVRLGKVRVYTLPNGKKKVRLLLSLKPDDPLVEYDLEIQEEGIVDEVVVTDMPKTNRIEDRASKCSKWTNPNTIL